MEEFLPILIVVILIVLLIAGIVSIAKDKNKGGGTTVMNALHDMQTKDKQNATEVVIEQKAGKKMQIQESGNKKDQD